MGKCKVGMDEKYARQDFLNACKVEYLLFMVGYFVVESCRELVWLRCGICVCCCCEGQKRGDGIELK